MNTATTRMLLAAVTAVGLSVSTGSPARADVNSPAILQWFEGSYSTIERRTVDYFMAGYGSVWTPPPGRADSGNQSVGYDQYNRFDLGGPNAPTLYGTEKGLKTTVASIQRAGGRFFVDLVWNHNGFRDSSSPGFNAEGGYPGFVLNWPGTSDGDFHSAFAGGDLDGRLSGLIDIDHSKNIQLIRNPVTPGDSRNIPLTGAGPHYANVPTEANRRFYQDRNRAPDRYLFDPTTGEQNIPVWDFTSDTATTGTPVTENGLGYLMRNAQWLVQTVGVDGFRLDATKHMEPWVLNYLDRAVYRTIKKPLLDGSQQHVFSFGEFFDSDVNKIQATIRKDINPNDPGRIGGNRDALDFPLFDALSNNLTSNGIQNDWRNVVNATLDRNDDGLANNGSQGVGFAGSHDSFAPALSNVANAYVLMRPGNATVYFNGKEFGQNRDFPKDGRGDALGGQYGDTLTKLVDIRLRYAEGDYLPRLVEKETYVVERSNSLVAAYSNRGDSGFDSRSILTNFAPGTPLIELTGNASDPTVDPGNNIPELVVVNGDHTINFAVPRNGSHGKGYVIYGVATPQGSVSLSNIAQTLGPQAQNGNNNGTARINAISVIKSDSFTVSLQTQQVNLLGFYRDVNADGDNALLKIDGGLDLNANGQVDNVTPNTASYGYETFTVSSPLYGGGTGAFSQTIDTTQLSEGMHYLEVRAFRHRNVGEPAVFSSWRQGFYIDRLKPISVVNSFNPALTGINENRIALVQSTDLTANNVHILLDLAPNLTDNQVLFLLNGNSQASQADRDLWQRTFTGLTSGNHVLTVVSFEETGTYNIQRYSGYSTSTIFGAGLGDLNFNGTYSPADISLFASLLNANGSAFNPAADLSADGLITSADLFLLGNRLISVGASVDTMAAYNALVTSVPEPSSTILLLPFAALLKRRRT